MGTTVPTLRACSIEDCDRVGRITRGMCDLHYQRWKRRGTVELPPPHPRCSVERCTRLALYGEMCRTHYARLVNTGSTEPAQPPAEWVNPLVCVCPEPDADPRRDFGMCQVCFRKPAALLKPPSEAAS